MYGIIWFSFLFFLVQCDVYHYNKNELQYAECSVCKETMKVIARNVSNLRKEKKKWEVLSEEVFLGYMENVCNPDTEQGEWILKLDLVPFKGRLRVEAKSSYGKCKTECQTISEICSKFMERHDVAISEMLWKKAERSKLTNRVCKKLSKSCTKKRLKNLKKASAPLGQEQFEPMTDDEWQTHKLMRSMKDMPGMPGMEMYDRDDLKDMLGKTDDASDSDKDEGFMDKLPSLNLMQYWQNLLESNMMGHFFGVVELGTNFWKNVWGTFLDRTNLTDNWKTVSKSISKLWKSISKSIFKKKSLKKLKKDVLKSDIVKHLKESAQYNYDFWKNICTDLYKKTKNYKKTWKKMRKSKMMKRKFWKRRWKKLRSFVMSVRKDMLKTDL